MPEKFGPLNKNTPPEKTIEFYEQKLNEGKGNKRQREKYQKIIKEKQRDVKAEVHKKVMDNKHQELLKELKEGNVSKYTIGYYKARLEDAEEAGVDVTEYEKELPELTKQVWEKVMDNKHQELLKELKEGNVSKYTIGYYKARLEDAEEAGVDVTEYEKELPELTKQVWEKVMDNKHQELLKELKEGNVSKYTIGYYKARLEDAEEAGVDVTEYEKELPELTKQVWEKVMDNKHQELLKELKEGNVSKYTIGYYKARLEDAEEAGVDVTEYEKELPELTKQVWEKVMDNKHQELLKELKEGNVSKYTIGYYKARLEDAEEAGVDVTEYEKELPELTKQVWEKVMDNKHQELLKELKEGNVSKYTIGYYKARLEDAEEAGVDVTEYEKELPELTKQVWEKVMDNKHQELLKELKEGNVSKYTIGYYKARLEDAEEAGVDVTEYEKELPELTKQVWEKVMDNKHQELLKELKEGNVSKYTIGYYKARLEDAEEAGVDVTEYEKELPELTKQVN